MRRISMTLRRWHERECDDSYWCLVRGRMVDGDFEYDDDAYEKHAGASGRTCYTRVPDWERIAHEQLGAIISTIKGDLLSAYIQTDPRGCALYILRPGDAYSPPHYQPWNEGRIFAT